MSDIGRLFNEGLLEPRDLLDMIDDLESRVSTAETQVADAWDEGYECAYRIQEKKRGSVTKHGARHLTPPNPYRASTNGAES